MDLAATNKTELERWRERLNATGLPVFARTVREVSHVANSMASSAADLSAVVGRDASMSAKIIQIANSPVFNLQNRAINTIAEAVVMVGFDSIRELAISVSVLEELQKGPQHERCATLMARAFHAAAHSKFIDQLAGTGASDDVFVGALLREVGPMAFWSRAGEMAEPLNQALTQATTDTARVEAEQRCLGFSLDELSLALAADWSLGDLLVEVLKGRDNHPGVQSIVQGHALALEIEQRGLDSAEVKQSIRGLAKHLGRPEADVAAAIQENFDAASDLVRHLGISVSAPDPLPVSGQGTTTEPAASAPPAPEVVFQVLQDIAAAMEQRQSRDVMMQAVVEAVHDALGYTGSAFALFTPDRSALIVKFRAGEPLFSDSLIDPDQLSLDVSQSDAGKVFSHVEGNGVRHTVCVRINDKPVGILFGLVSDNSPSAEGFIGAFRQMAQQLTLILTASL